MTAPADLGNDPVRAFRAALGRDLDARLNTTVTVTALIHTAIRDHHWTPRQLADECARDLHDVINAGAVVTDRLRKAATHPPVARPAAVPGAVLPFCTPRCRANAGWVVDDDGTPVGRCECRTPQEAPA